MCCTECNNALGAIEEVLCGDLRTLSAALAARDAQNKSIATTMRVGDKTYRYADGVGEELLPAPKYDAKTRALVFPLPGSAAEQAAVIARMLWEQGRTPSDIDTGKFVIEPDTTFGVRPYPPTRTKLETTLRFGIEEHMRVAAKMALELLAVRHPADGRRWSELRTARHFIRYGDGVLPVRTEARSKGAGLRRPRGFPVLAHAVEVWTHKRNLHFRATFFGRLHATGTLTTAWQGPRLRLLHALDPTRPGRHVDAAAEKDGRALGVWHEGLKPETFAAFVQWFEKQAALVSRRVTRRPFVNPTAPDLATLRL